MPAKEPDQPWKQQEEQTSGQVKECPSGQNQPGQHRGHTAERFPIDTSSAACFKNLTNVFTNPPKIDKNFRFVI